MVETSHVLLLPNLVSTYKFECYISHHDLILFLTQRQEPIIVSPVSVAQCDDHHISRGSQVEFLSSYQVVLYNYSEVCSVGSSLFVPVLSAQRGASCCFPAEACGSLLPGTPRGWWDVCDHQQGCWGCLHVWILTESVLCKAIGKCCLSSFCLCCSKSHEDIQS